MTEESKEILTSEQEKDIGLIQKVIDTGAKNILAILVLAPTAYMAIKGTPIPDAYWTVVGAVVAYYFKTNGK